MSRRIRRPEWFIADLEHYGARYEREAGWALAERYLRSVSATIKRLAGRPGIGLARNRFVQIQQHVGDSGHGGEVRMIEAFRDFRFADLEQGLGTFRIGFEGG
jgi:hypothetical protein